MPNAHALAQAWAYTMWTTPKPFGSMMSRWCVKQSCIRHIFRWIIMAALYKFLAASELILQRRYAKSWLIARKRNWFAHRKMNALFFATNLKVNRNLWEKHLPFAWRATKTMMSSWSQLTALNQCVNVKNVFPLEWRLIGIRYGSRCLATCPLSFLLLVFIRFLRTSLLHDAHRGSVLYLCATGARINKQ